MPITLRGDNLGQRHQHFNSLVQDAYQNSSLELVLKLPEASPLDKLFKIDLASKHRNVEFILETLKHDNMLYVSRALKCSWLLESKYRDIINAEYLECKVYPYMLTPAVHKMKHWLQNNLRESWRCQEFYKYYADNYDMKIKFLGRCGPEFIEAEFMNVINKITPKQLKILCECCPQVLKLYFDNLDKNPQTLENYLGNDRKYFDCCKYILNVDPDSYFAIIEKYYDHNRFGSLHAAVTRHIMRNHKRRFVAKPELYAAWILDRHTLAKHLNSEEAKDLVLKLARAQYLGQWFSYKSVEPFIKRLEPDQRAAFKKQVFVDETIGDKVNEWPYPRPSRPRPENLESVFDDVEFNPGDYKIFEPIMFRRCIKKRKFEKYACPMMCAMDCVMPPRKTKLDELFDRYRFYGFDRTMFELRKLLAAESSVKNREFMMLVLVSKCGENMDQIEKLLRFLAERHYNESHNLRATIVRSLVVRACVWRLPSNAWSILLDFGRDLGIDGGQPLTCREGMHAAVLRVLLSKQKCLDTLNTAFFDNFSALTEYKLNKAELCMVKERLPAWIMTSAAEASESSLAQERIQILLQALSELKVNVRDCPGAVDAIVEAIRRDPTEAEYLIPRVYNMRIARRELFRENFIAFLTNESYINVLRHDATLLKTTDAFEKSVRSHSFYYDGFLKKLSLYFAEENGLAAVHKEAIGRIVADEPHVCLARPLALLRGDIRPIIKKYLNEPNGSAKRQLGAALQSNYHLSDVLDVDADFWKLYGVKSIANRVLICKAMDVEKYIEKSLEWRRTFKLALHLAERSEDISEIYHRVVDKRPAAALRLALSYFRRNKSYKVEKDLWRVVAPALTVIDLSIEQRRDLRKTLEEADFIPSDVQAQYWSDVFKAFQKISVKKALPILCRLENLLPEVDSEVIRKVIEEFLTEFTHETVSVDDFKYQKSYCMKSRIVAKYLLISKTEAEQKDRLVTIWKPFCERLTSALEQNAKTASPYLDAFVNALKYHRAFFAGTVSCLPVLERIVTDLRKSLPMEGFFPIFVVLHTVMLYYNSIDHCTKNHPEYFQDQKTKSSEGMIAVGHLFGNYVGREVHELASKYFKSVVTLYQDTLMTLLRDQTRYNENKKKFVTAFVKGLVEAGNTHAMRVALHVLHEERDAHDDPDRVELLNRLKQSEDMEIKFFSHADVYTRGMFPGVVPLPLPPMPRSALFST